MEKIRSTGASSVTEFLARYPAIPFHKLLRQLGMLMAPMQLNTLQFDEAIANDKVRDAVKDLLVRTLNDITKRGWGRGGHWESNRAMAYSHFVTDVPTYSRNAVKQDVAIKVWMALESLQPPVGWLPVSVNDPLIEKAFEIGWPETSKAGDVR